MLATVAATARTLIASGMLTPVLPRPRLARLALRLPFLAPGAGAAVEAHAAARPHAVALIDDAGALTWDELDERVNRLANALCEHPAAERGSGRVAFMVRNGREALECYAAAGRAGLAAVPLNTWASPREVDAVVASQQPLAVIGAAEFRDVLDATDLRGALRLEVGGDGTYEQALADAATRPPPVRASATVVIHTSGTTGIPKGAERRLRLSNVQALVGFLEKVPLHRRDRFLVAPPLFHAFAQGMTSVGLVLGATLVLPRQFDPEGFLAAVATHRVTAAALVPVMLRRILEVQGPVPQTLRTVVLSGEPLSEHLRVQAEGRFGRVFYDLYGSTEVGWAAIATPSDQRSKPGSVGTPARGMRVFAADEDGRVLPAGREGRLFAATGFEFDRYTGEASDPAELDGALELGDRGWVDEDGYVFVAGRADDMIVSGGENIYPSEVEAVLDEHPDVADAAVVGVADDEYGQVLHAFVVPRQGQEIDADAVREFLRARLARFKVPKHLEVVEQLPRTASGKVVRDALTPPASRPSNRDDPRNRSSTR